MLTDGINPDSPAALIIRHWGPPLITIVLGGLFASILFPRWQDAYTRSRAASQHRIDLTEQIASAFTSYITAWRRLIAIAELGAERELSQAESDRLNGFVAERNEARDDLLDLCARGQLYFSDGACDSISEFVAWDEDQSTKRLNELPDIEEWRSWEKKILRRLKGELLGERC
jgi:hypothetical protein